MKRVVSLGTLAILLTACISISRAEATPTPVRFVTSTLPPTQAAQSRLTLTPPTEPAACRDAAILIQDVTIPDGTNTSGRRHVHQNTGGSRIPASVSGSGIRSLLHSGDTDERALGAFHCCTMLRPEKL